MSVKEFPLGGPHVESYVERVKRNLYSLEKYPDLKLNYEFSAVELKELCERFPDVYKKIREMYQKGRLDFVNGTFSQPHLQVFSSESSWRQFEMGLEIYKKFFDAKVDVFACQETCLHQQMPQLLKKFGYSYMALPTFPWAMDVYEGNMELVGFFDGADTVKDEDFIDGVALDGSSILVFTKIIDALDFHKRDLFLEEINKDLYAGSPVWTYTPDLAEVDESLYNEITDLFDFTILKTALSERYKSIKPKAKARVYTYWSYIEGVWAEELLRKNRVAEETALLAEGMLSLVRMNGVESCFERQMQNIWHDILKYQHHDVYWIEVTDLRRKAIECLDAGFEQCKDIMKNTVASMVKKDENSVSIFNILPEKRRILIELERNITDSNIEFQTYRNKYFGFVDVPSGGFKSFAISNEDIIPPKEMSLPDKIQTVHYCVEFNEQGLISQITTQNGKNLLQADRYFGGEIRAMIEDEWVSNTSGQCRFVDGSVAYILERESRLGCIPVKETYFFFKKEKLIKAEIEFDFNGNEVGYFWLDETKINVYYPTVDLEIYHDIPFGYVKGKENRALFATNWLYCGGLAYINRGTVKHWVKDGVIANMLAWGGNNFTNRMHSEWADKKQYDIRLYGKQKIEYYIIPYGEFDGNRIVKDVNAITFPVFIAAGDGERSYYDLGGKDLAVTSVYCKEGDIWARGYKLPSEEKSKFSAFEIFNEPLNRL